MIIETTKGPMDDAQLRKAEGTTGNSTWVEYYLGNELVHRSAHIDLGRPVTFESGTSNG